MDLKVGMKAIIVNVNGNHAEYNFQKCEIEDIKSEKRILVSVESDELITKFFVPRNELIPLVYDSPEDLKKYKLSVEDISKLFTEYKGYYDTICSLCDGFGNDLDEKDKQIEELKHRIDCLESDKKELRSRCKGSAMENFDNHLYGLLHIVGREDLESCTQNLPDVPIKVADMLINAKYTVEKVQAEKTFGALFGNCSDVSTHDVYSIGDLRQIAEHLLVYCNANVDKE